MASWQASWRLNTVAWIPVAFLLALILALWSADLRTLYDLPYQLIGSNLIFLTLVPLCVVFSGARIFLATASPGFLLAACGAFFWSAAGLAESIASLARIDGGRFDPSPWIATHDTFVWVSALSHLAGTALAMRWNRLFLHTPRRWLAGAGAVIFCMTVLIVAAIHSDWTPSFFVSGNGGTTIRQFVLASSIGMFGLIAALLWERAPRRMPAFVTWYAIAVQLLATGLLGSMLAADPDSALSWVGRAAQYLGGAYMLAAAIAASLTASAGRITFALVRHHVLHTYGIAAALVAAAAAVRLVFMQSLGTNVGFLTFYPAIMLAALYAGFRSGLLATVLSLILADFFLIQPALSLRAGNPSAVLAATVFLVSCVMISWIVERMHRALAQRGEAEAGQKRLNRALRLLSDCNMTLVRARAEPELLNDLCQVIVESGGYRMAWVGVAEEDAARSIKPVAQFGAVNGYLESLRISWDGEQDIGRGPTGATIRTGITQVNQDSRTNPMMAPWREAALERGYQSSVALPIRDENRIFGALTIYSAEMEAFSAEEVRLLEELAGNVDYGIKSLRTRNELMRHQLHLEELVAERTQEIAELNLELTARARDAESANRAKSVFVATMSHEMRNPLNAVVGLADLLADSPLDRRQRDYADKIRSSAQALRTLIDDVLDFSKIEAGALVIENAPFSLNAILHTTAAILSIGIRDKAVEPLFDVASDIPDALFGDALRLQQVILNLTSNAAKFTEAGEVVVSVRRLAQESGQVTLQFAVRDTGIGIPPEQLRRIFEVFAQADASISRKYGGTGLGLSISARLANLMGGTIDVDSTAGQGSEFRFTVTLGLVDCAPAVPPQERLAGLSMLIIDDHANARHILRQACDAFGWQAIACDSGAAGLDELRRSTAEGRPYDLMLVDWRMPGMDGIEMLRLALADPSIRLPLVLLMASTFELEHAAAQTDDLHLEGILPKPLTPASLFDGVARAYAGERLGLAPANARTDRRLAGMRLLVAEDNELNQQVIEQILTRAGAEVTIAANGQEAVEALQASDAHFDAVLMDIQMPVMDGYAATRLIREEMGLVDLPIIAVTAYAQPEDRENSRRAGMAGHIVKPLEVEDLLDIVAAGRQGSPNKAAEASRSASRGASIVPLAGLDLGAALETFGGDTKKYAELLRQFAVRCAADADEAQRLFSAGDTAGAAKLVHDMRGIAGFLRATEVARSATSAEQALLCGNNDAVPALFDELRLALHGLAQSIEQLDAMIAA